MDAHEIMPKHASRLDASEGRAGAMSIKSEMKKQIVKSKTGLRLASRKPKKPTPAEPVAFVTCEHCGNEQADMGKNVLCEQCDEAIS